KPQAARITLENVLGPATIVVRSGGKWTNPETGEIEDKLHLHWRLKVPARTADDIKKLKRARRIGTELVGGDTTNVPACHPIRWPGSWHRKGEPRLCEIVDAKPDVEISLDEALEALEPFAAKPKPGEDTEQSPRIEGDPLDWIYAVSKI